MEEKSVATLDRTLAILAAFTEETPRLSLTELSRRTGMYKSTVARLLASLRQSDLIEQNEDGEFHVGIMAMRLANLYQRSFKVSDVIGKALAKLVSTTAENANFYVRRGDARVCVYYADSPQRIRAHSLIGDIFPLERGAGGKILSAFSEDLADAEGLDTVRENCIAISHGEYASDLTGIAAPVFGMHDRIEGAIAVTGPTVRFTPERIALSQIALLKAALGLTLAFGGDTKLLEAASFRAEQDVVTKRERRHTMTEGAPRASSRAPRAPKPTQVGNKT